jgi:hypothetical protein
MSRKIIWEGDVYDRHWRILLINDRGVCCIQVNDGDGWKDWSYEAGIAYAALYDLHERITKAGAEREKRDR